MIRTNRTTRGALVVLGLALVLAGNHAGWALALPAAPAGGGLGLLLARKLAARL